MKKLPNGEHPAWFWVALAMAFLVIVLHGSFSRTENTALEVGGANLSAGYTVGAQRASHA